MNNSTADPTKRFTDRVTNYLKYRPGYPKTIIEFLKEKLNLKPSDIIADIGSGTGIFSELFLKNGNIVYAVEPNNEMRNAAENILGGNSNFFSIKASAESTTLNNSSVDFITCAQAFHWFQWEQTKKEFLRILKDNGWIILIWNSRINTASNFMLAFEQFLTSYSKDYQKVNHSNIDKNTFDNFFKSYNIEIFPNHQDFDFKGLKGRVLSASYIPLEGDSLYMPMILELEKIFEEFEENGIVKMIYKTEVYYGKIF